MLEQPTDAAGRQHNSAGRHQDGAGVRRHKHADDGAIGGQQTARFETLEHRDRGRRPYRLGEGAHDLLTCAVAGRVHDATPRMRGLHAKLQRTARSAVKAHAVAQQRFNGRRPSHGDTPRDVHVAQSSARREGVGEMQRRIVIRTHSSGDTTLCPDARGLTLQGRLGEHHNWHRRQTKRRHQSGNSTANDNGHATDVAPDQGF